MYFDLIVYTGVVFLINIITYYIGKELRIIDNPNIQRKIHKINIVCVGGVSIFVSYMIMIYKLNLPNDIINIFLFGSYVAILGLVDDKFNIDPFIRIFVQIGIITYFLYKTDLYIDNIIITENTTISLGGYSELITILAIIYVINSFNYIDGIDGLCGLMFISIFSYFIFVFKAEYLAYTLIPVIIFLLFNFSFFKLPKVFLGDNGSTLLGFLLSVFCIYFSKHVSFDLRVNDGMIIWLLAYVSFEFLATTLSRLMRKKSIFSSGKDHFHYLVMDLIKSSKLTLVLILILNQIFVTLGIIINIFVPNFSFLIFIIFFIIYFLFREKLLKSSKLII
tara:strand:+ start:610 stop:1614 length:1005 start_codon:yes stop_codon:yes gene_type:complete